MPDLASANEAAASCPCSNLLLLRRQRHRMSFWVGPSGAHSRVLPCTRSHRRVWLPCWAEPRQAFSAQDPSCKWY
jgi:hypothetical protein